MESEDKQNGTHATSGMFGNGAPTPILDVRSPDAFEGGHRIGAVNIPLADLAGRIHELPSPHQPMLIYDADACRARWGLSRLKARGRHLIEAVWGEDWLTGGEVEQGPSTRRLWSPHGLLIRALAVAEAKWGELVGRRALDIACGTGRDAVYMASRGLIVDAWDNLPDAIDRCRDLAARNCVSVNAAMCDVVADFRAEAGSYDLITCFNFLHRPLMVALGGAVRPGGMVVYETFTREQKRLFGKPRSESHLLESGELPRLFEGWEIVETNESLVSPRRFVASLIAMKKKDERS